MSELKHCPFCGGNALMRICDRFGRNETNPNAKMSEEKRKLLSEYKVMCFRCGARTKSYKTLKGAFNAWNRRKGEEE